MTAPAASRNAQAGFTLLELLISITILSLILLALSGGVHFAGQAWRAQEQRSARQGDVNAVQTVLRQMIASGQGFRGNALQLKFTGKLPAALARGGLFDIALDAAGGALILSWEPHFKGPATRSGEGEAKLLDGLTSFAFGYYNPALGWQRAASDKTKRPLLIAMGGRLSGGQTWPPLTVAPILDVAAAAKPAAAAPAAPAPQTTP